MPAPGSPSRITASRSASVRNGIRATIEGPSSPPPPSVPWHAAQRLAKTRRPGSTFCASARDAHATAATIETATCNGNWTHETSLRDEPLSQEIHMHARIVTAPGWPPLEIVRSARSEPRSSRPCSPTIPLSGVANPLRRSTAGEAPFRSNCRRRRPVLRTDARPLAVSPWSSSPLSRALAHHWGEARNRAIVPDAVRSTSPAAAACRDLGTRPQSCAPRR